MHSGAVKAKFHYAIQVADLVANLFWVETSSVITFFVPRRKVWLTPTDRVQCSNAANIEERKTWTQSEVCTWQNSVRGQKPPKNVYIVHQLRRRPNIVQSLVGIR